MKKIINGKKYDTETARVIGFYDNNMNYSDFRWYEETLYRKKNGEFFMYGEGGGLSPYRKRYADGWGEGSQLILVTEDDAKAWVEKHLSYEDYVDLFGEPEE